MKQTSTKKLSNVQQYEEIVDCLNARGKIVGLDVLKENKKSSSNFLLKFALTDAVLYTGLIIYSTYIFYGDFLQSAFCWTTLGLAFDSIMRFYVFIYRRSDLHKLLRDTRLLFQRNEDDPEGNKKLGRILKFAKIANTLTFLSLSGTCITLNSMAIMETLRTGEKTLVFGFYLPLLDHKTTIGYAINYLYQNIQMVLVSFHSSQGDGFYIVHMILGCARLEAIGHKIDLLNRYLISEDRELLSPREDSKIIDEYLRDILNQHLAHIEYMKRLEYLFSTYAFFLISSCMFVIVINIFVFITIFWLEGLFLSSAMLFKIMAFCVLGTIVSIKDKEIIEKLYDLKWYLMPKEHQKSLLMILRSAQHPVEATMMKVKPLNLNTFLACLNMIYSLSAMLFTITKKKEL